MEFGSTGCGKRLLRAGKQHLGGSDTVEVDTKFIG
jgi:hypothetical protein